MNADLVALLYLVAGVLFILALRGLSSPETSRRGNLFGMVGMAIAIADHARLASAGRHRRLGAGDRRHGGRRRRRRRDRAPRADDGDAGAGRGVPFAGRHGGGAGRGRRRSTRRRPSTSAPSAAIHKVEPGRDVARGRHRCRDLHWLGDRIPQAIRSHERRADHAAGAPRHQYRPGAGHGAPGRLARARGKPSRVLAD